jgi:hypothetical protein
VATILDFRSTKQKKTHKCFRRSYKETSIAKFLIQLYTSIKYELHDYICSFTGDLLFIGAPFLYYWNLLAFTEITGADEPQFGRNVTSIRKIFFHLISHKFLF